MSLRQSDSRQRMLIAAAEMLARHGLNATSIREMAKRAEAPVGSTYHHFPGGKQQVLVEAVQLAGARVDAGLERQLQAGLAAGLKGFLAMWRDILQREQFRVGCPVMASVVEEPTEDIVEPVLDAAARVFEGWIARLSRAMRAEGRSRREADDLSTLIVAGVEGAIVLCRAQRDIEPFDRVSRQLQSMLR